MAQSIRDDDGVSNPSRNLSLTDVVERAVAARPSRRKLLLGGLGAAALPFLGGLAACGGDDDEPAAAVPPLASRPRAPAPHAVQPPWKAQNARP